ncbi:regucalcin-like [Trichogramma pretiosum]|uniref:regucalcin-like n=1 Tax=Trichogramma pretiosum TaxID=7493 RepID=UPI0006C93DB5|nr:regucalcin-like [Trichogramma pretiosum]
MCKYSLSIFLKVLILVASISRRVDGQVSIRKVTAAVELAEGPHWDYKSQSLYYVNILGKQILRLDPLTGRVNRVTFPGDQLISFVIPVQGRRSQLIVGRGLDVVLLDWDGREDVTEPSYEVVASLVDRDADPARQRINDAKCDPRGRLLLGTMALKSAEGSVEPNRGALYKIGGRRLQVERLLSPVTISNGLAWNARGNVLYYIDSASYQVWALDYRLATGRLQAADKKRVIIDLKVAGIEGMPDGMTIDDEGNLWIAVFGGGCVLNVDPRAKKLLRKIDLPVPQVTSVAFGGPHLDVLYVTTAREDLTEAQLLEKPDSGSVYAITGLGVRGRVASDFSLN